MNNEKFNLTLSVTGEDGRVKHFKFIQADSALQLSVQFSMALIQIMRDIQDEELAELKNRAEIDDIPF